MDNEAIETRADVIQADAPDTFWMIELNDGSGWLASLRGKVSSDAVQCLRFDTVEMANHARNGLPHSLWSRFKTNATEHQWVNLDQLRPEAAKVDGKIVAHHGSADSHVFDDRILIGGECIAFADEPWTSRIVAALSASPLPGREAIAEAVEGLDGAWTWIDHLPQGETAQEHLNAIDAACTLLRSLTPSPVGEGISREWCEKMARAEGDAEIGAGMVALDPDFSTLPPIDKEAQES